MARRWRLFLGDEFMAELVDIDFEQPWFTVSVTPQPGYARFLPYFTDPGEWPDEPSEVDAICAEVSRRGPFRLTDDTGTEMSHFTLVNMTTTHGNLRL